MSKVQMRVGDLLVLYNTHHIPHDLQPKIIFPESLYASKASSQKSPPKTNGKNNYNSHTTLNSKK